MGIFSNKRKDNAKFNQIAVIHKGQRVFYAMLGLAVIVLSIILITKCSNDKKTPEKKPVQAATTATPPASMLATQSGSFSDVEVGTGYVDVIINGHTYRVTDGQTVLDFDSNGNSWTVSDQELRQTILDGVSSLAEEDANIRIQLGDFDSIEVKDTTTVPVQTVTGESDPQSRIRMLALETLGVSYEDFMQTASDAGWTIDDFLVFIDAGYSVDSAWTMMRNQAELKRSNLRIEDSAVAEAVTSVFNGDSSSVAFASDSDEIEYPSWLSDSDSFLGDSISALITNLNAAAKSDETDAATGLLSGLTNNNNIYSSAWGAYDAQTAWLTSQQSKEVQEGPTGRITKYDLVAGTIVPITLVTGINTDFAGQVIGMTRADVYDSYTGTVVLIPKGTRLVANYNSNVRFGQDQVQVAWQYMILPDGYTFELPGFQGVNGEGYPGVDGKYDAHIWTLIGGALLGSVINIGSAYGNVQVAQATNNNEYAMELYNDAVAPVQNLGTSYSNYMVNRQPTIKVAVGTSTLLLVSETINLQRPGI